MQAYNRKTSKHQVLTLVPLFAMFYCTISFILFVYLYQSGAALKYKTAYEKLAVYTGFTFEVQIFMHWMMEFLPYSRAITAAIDDESMFESQKWLYSSIFSPPPPPPKDPSQSLTSLDVGTNLAELNFGLGPEDLYKPIQRRFVDQYSFLLQLWGRMEQTTRISIELGISDREFQNVKTSNQALKPVYTVDFNKLQSADPGERIYSISYIPANIHMQYITGGLKVITEIGKELDYFIKDTEGGRTVLLGNDDWLEGQNLMAKIGTRCLSLIAGFLEFGESDILKTIDWYSNVLIPLLKSNFIGVTTYFLVSYGFVVFFNLCWMLYSNYWINKHMTKLIGCYCMLTDHELQLHQAKIVKEKLFFRIQELSDEAFLAFNTGNYGVAKKKELQNQAKNLRMNKLTKDKIVPSIKISLFLSLIVTGIYSAFIVLAFLSMSSADKMRQFDLMFIQQTQLTFKLCQSVFQTESYILFGDYIKLNGKESGAQFNPTAVSDFNSYWISNRDEVSSMLGEFYERVDNFINRNSCSLIGHDRPQLCLENSLANSNGFLYFTVYLEKNFQNTLLDYQLANQKELTQSSSDFGFIGESAWYQSEFLTTRVVFIETVSSFYRVLIAAYPKLLQNLHDKYSSEFHDMIVGVLTGCGIFILVAASVSRYLTHRDKDYCYETFKVIQPETILSNAYILNSFKKYYG